MNNGRLSLPHKCIEHHDWKIGAEESKIKSEILY